MSSVHAAAGVRGKGENRFVCSLRPTDHLARNGLTFLVCTRERAREREARRVTRLDLVRDRNACNFVASGAPGNFKTTTLPVLFRPFKFPATAASQMREETAQKVTK